MTRLISDTDVGIRTETGMIRVGDGIVASPQIAVITMSMDELRARAGLPPLPIAPNKKGSPA